MLLVFTPRMKAFSLLGPYTDWMVNTNGYREATDIGGPMNINEEYRWNVPVITYGFDQSFLNYFGSNGVVAVESAIQILNDLPAASDIILSNYPSATERIDFQAAALNVYDLKSTALVLLVEHLGLGQPTRNILDLKSWSPDLQYPPPVCTNEVCPQLIKVQNDVIQRNFDPETLDSSFVVNGTAYSGYLYSNGLHDIIEFPLDPEAPTDSAVADGFSFWYTGLQPGGFYLGLTADDAGGLRYLLNVTNVNWERLPADVLFRSIAGRELRRVRGAWRPGVEKITFLPQPQNKRGKFKTAVFNFTAAYVTNGVTVEQPVRRVVRHPDILFSAADAYLSDSNSPIFLQTGTSGWINNAGQNGNPTNAGPGVINSPVQITFDDLGPDVLSGSSFNPAVVMNRGWASFDESTNPPVLYPPNTGQNQLLVRLHFYDITAMPLTEVSTTLFKVAVPFGSPATLQISTNQTDWISVAAVTNSGSIVRWDYLGTKTSVSFTVVPGAL
jgi:hypothetical protein